MQNSDILNIYFYDNIKNDLDNFESSCLRKNLKASLELNDYRYLTNAIDERIEAVCYLNFNDVNRFNYFKGKDFKKITFAFYSEFENDFKILSINKDKSKNTLYQFKESYVKTLSEFDLIFTPSQEAKKLLLDNGVKANIEVLPIAVTGVAIAVADKPEGVAQTFKVSLTGNMPQVIDHLIDVAIGETGIMIEQVSVQIVDFRVFDKQWFAQLAVDGSSMGVLPALGLQQVD